MTSGWRIKSVWKGIAMSIVSTDQGTVFSVTHVVWVLIPNTLNGKKIVGSHVFAYMI